ncbi:MAG: ArnT family glycosyltransferase [Anaerolineae bacterium]
MADPRPHRRSSPPWRMGVAIFLLALLVRLMPSGLYVTPDELIWVQRSAQFLDAVRAGNWAAVPQTGHPGLTTMVLGATGIWLRTKLDPQVSAAHLDWIRQLAWLAPENDEALKHLAFFLTEARVLVACATALGILGVYVLGRRRLNERTARLVGLFLALDPFFAGHSGLLHTDALQATFLMLAAVLAFPVRRLMSPSVLKTHLVVERSLSMVGAALCLAFAGLTKTLALAAAPGLALALLVFGEGNWRKRVVRVATLTLLTLVFFLMLYPPFWVTPRAALRHLIDAVTYHEGLGLRPTFFWGEERFNPGPAFYPLVLLFRMTPPVLLGLILTATGWFRSRNEKCVWTSSFSLTGRWFALPIVTYLAVLTIATKKFDRYALSLLLFVTPIAATYWAGSRKAWRLVLLSTLLLPWAFVAVVPLHYASPLLGGSWVAEQVVPLGWGETSGLTARALNSRLSEPESSILMTRNVPGAASIFAGCVWSWDEARLPCASAVIGYKGVALENHVPLLDMHVAGRRLATIYAADDPLESEIPPLAAGKLPGVTASSVPPVTDTASLQRWLLKRFGSGDPFLWIHAGSCYPLMESQLKAALRVDQEDSLVTCDQGETVMGLDSECCTLRDGPPAYGQMTQFGGVLDLLAAAWDEQVEAPDPLTVHLRWLPHVQLTPLDVYFALQTEAGGQSLTWLESGERLISEWQWSAENWQPGMITDVVADLATPVDLPPGEYQLVMGLISETGWIGHALPDGTFGGIELVLGTVRVIRPAYPASNLNLPLAIDADLAGLHVLGAVPPSAEVWAGASLEFRLGLERAQDTPLDPIRWELRCQGGERDGGLLTWGPGRPDGWPLSYRFISRHAPRLRPDLPEDLCSLVLASEDARQVPIATIQVRQRDRVFELPRSPDIPMNVGVGEFAALTGADLSVSEVAPGDTLSVALYWQARGRADRDYTVFVHLFGPEGRVWGQSDGYPMDGGAPTTSWIAGEIVVDHHSIQLRNEAPPGLYEVRVGLYDVKRGTRVAISREDEDLLKDQVQVATISVEE